MGTLYLGMYVFCTQGPYQTSGRCDLVKEDLSTARVWEVVSTQSRLQGKAYSKMNRTDSTQPVVLANCQ